MIKWNIYIGHEPREADALAVSRHSIKRHLTQPVPVHGIVLSDLRKRGVYNSGAKDTAEFDLIDSGNTCIPMMARQVAFSWLEDKMPDGYFMDALNKFVDDEIISIPDTINEKNLEEIHIPKWVKNTVAWWLEDKISDDDFSKAFQYLINKEIIKI